MSFDPTAFGDQIEIPSQMNDSTRRNLYNKYKDHGSFELVYDTFVNNGYNAVIDEKISFNDLIATPNASFWMPQVLETIIREPVEPLTIIPSILTRLDFQWGNRITFPSIGALRAYDYGENMTLPEQQLQIAPGSQIVTVGKSGVQFQITEEMKTHSAFDVMALHLRYGRMALDRWKEVKGFNYINSMGTVLFDNKAPTSSVFGVCTGRGINGAGNGSCRMEDLLKAYSHLMMQGQIPTALLMHPLAWSMWMIDPILQTIAKNTANGQWFQPHTMAKSGNQWASSNMNGLRGSSSPTVNPYVPAGNAASQTATPTNQIDPTINSPARVPSYFPYPLQVIVSPFVPYDVSNDTTDIIICSLENLGALVVGEDPRTMDWEDMNLETQWVKLREQYSFQIFENGQGVGVLKNVPIVPNEIALPVQATISSAGSLDTITAKTPISGL